MNNIVDELHGGDYDVDNLIQGIQNSIGKSMFPIRSKEE